MKASRKEGIYLTRVAIICTVMAGITALILITGNSNSVVALPFAVFWGIAAIGCWVVAGKNKAARRAGSEKEAPEESAPSAPRWCEDLRQGFKKGPDGKEYDWELKETWEDYPFPDYDAIHTYCEVALDDSGRTYYYRTRNPELQVGDTVYVPFGYNAPKKIGVITSMKNYIGHDAPFPLEKTKFIIGKVQ